MPLMKTKGSKARAVRVVRVTDSVLKCSFDNSTILIRKPKSLLLYSFELNYSFETILSFLTRDQIVLENNKLRKVIEDQKTFR